MRLIDADALKDGICRECTLYGTQDCVEKMDGECDWDIIGHINEAPTVDPVKHGHWTLCGTIGKIHVGVCSSCKRKFAVGYYCGRCGAIMDEVSE